MYSAIRNLVEFQFLTDANVRNRAELERETHQTIFNIEKNKFIDRIILSSVSTKIQSTKYVHQNLAVHKSQIVHNEINDISKRWINTYDDYQLTNTYNNKCNEMKRKIISNEKSPELI